MFEIEVTREEKECRHPMFVLYGNRKRYIVFKAFLMWANVFTQQHIMKESGLSNKVVGQLCNKWRKLVVAENTKEPHIFDDKIQRI